MGSQALAKEALHRLRIIFLLTPTETLNITSNPSNNLPATSSVSTPATNLPQPAYPLIRAPIYTASSK